MLTFAIALAAFPAGTVRDAYAQEGTTMQGQSGDWGGAMMGPWMMGPGMMGGGMMGQGMMGGQGRGAQMCGMMTAHIEGRLAFLRTELRIAEAQAALWDGYADAVRANARAMSDHCTAMMGPDGEGPLALPDRLDRHEQFMAAQLEVLRAMGAALKPLYAALDAEQKALADKLIWSPMGMM